MKRFIDRSTVSPPIVAVCMISLAVACGEPTSFNEQQSAGPARSNDEARVAGVDAGATDAGEADTGEGMADGGAVDGGAADGGEDGGTVDGGTDSGEADEDGTADGGTKPGEEILVEDGGTLVIDGVKVIRVGVNFEDYTDFDYNDAVLCFEGAFKVDDTDVVSYKEQTVAATTFSASGCRHQVDVKILHADGTKSSFSYRSNSGETLQLPFKIKSRLEVTMTTVEGSCSRTPVSMHDKQYAIVKPDVCNRSGN